jgi:hypothetical protein
MRWNWRTSRLPNRLLLLRVGQGLGETIGQEPRLCLLGRLLIALFELG